MKSKFFFKLLFIKVWSLAIDPEYFPKYVDRSSTHLQPSSASTSNQPPTLKEIQEYLRNNDKHIKKSMGPPPTPPATFTLSEAYMFSTTVHPYLFIYCTKNGRTPFVEKLLGGKNRNNDKLDNAELMMVDVSIIFRACLREINTSNERSDFLSEHFNEIIKKIMSYIVDVLDMEMLCKFFINLNLLWTTIKNNSILMNSKHFVMNCKHFANEL